MVEFWQEVRLHLLKNNASKCIEGTNKMSFDYVVVVEGLQAPC